MPLWTKTKPPSFRPDLEATDFGWTDPTTGEVLIAIGGLSGVGNALINRITVNRVAASVGQTITFTVWFNEDVTVTGTPQLSVNFNAAARLINYTSGSNSHMLLFTYTLVAGDVCTAGQVVVNSLGLNSGTIKDRGTANNATLTLTSADKTAVALVSVT